MEEIKQVARDTTKEWYDYELRCFVSNWCLLQYLVMITRAALTIKAQLCSYCSMDDMNLYTRHKWWSGST